LLSGTPLRPFSAAFLLHPALLCPSCMPLPHPPPPTHTQTVDAAALAVMVPLLLKGLRESTPIQRRCCVIITNMTKLVNSPVDAVNFLPK